MMLRLKGLHSDAKDMKRAGAFKAPSRSRLGLCIGLLAAGLVFFNPQKSESGLPESGLSDSGLPESGLFESESESLENDHTQDSQAAKEIGEVLHAIIAEQQKAWNRGDIEVFMGAYWKDERLTFSSGGATTRGYQATLERYRKRYPDRAAMGNLTFEGLETTSLGPTSAYTLGRWKLAKEIAAEGNFTLVWQKIDGEWKIVHDHSSQAPSVQQ